MPTFELRYKDHWNWVHYNGNPYEWDPSRAKLNPDIHAWLSKNKVRHTLMNTGSIITGICILDKNQAMLFKLTWL